MAVYTSNLSIKTGTSFKQVFTLEDGVSNSPLDLTGFDVSAQMRKHAGANTGITTFTSSIFDATGGQVQIGLSTTQTAELKVGRHVYDVELSHAESGTGNTIVERIMEGRIQVTPSVTK